MRRNNDNGRKQKKVGWMTYKDDMTFTSDTGFNLYNLTSILIRSHLMYKEPGALTWNSLHASYKLLLRI